MLNREISAAVPMTGDSYSSQTDKGQARMKLHDSLERVRHTYANSRRALHEFLLRTERQLAFGDVNEGIFLRTRSFVDQRLSEFAPEALDRFVGAYRGIRSGDDESLTHAATSCRRVLSALADVVCPPSPSPVTGTDGKQHSLTSDKHVNRLLWFVQAHVGEHGLGPLVTANLRDMAARLEALEKISGKGVHANVGQDEVAALAINTYLLAGELLKLHETSRSASPNDARDAPDRELSAGRPISQG